MGPTSVAAAADLSATRRLSDGSADARLRVSLGGRPRHDHCIRRRPSAPSSSPSSCDRAPDLRRPSGCPASAGSSAPACASSRSRSPARATRTTTTTTDSRADAEAPRSAVPRARTTPRRRRGRPRALLSARAVAPQQRRWPRALRPVAHEDRLSLVEHLTSCARGSSSAWSRSSSSRCLLLAERPVLDILNQPLEQTRPRAVTTRARPARAGRALAARRSSALNERSPRPRQAARATHAPRDARRSRAGRAARRAPRPPRDGAPRAIAARQPGHARRRRAVHATLQCAGYAALLISLPLMLFQLYAFVLPAFSPRERQVALPPMLMVPFLFFAGVVFGYFVVLPRAIDFLQNFNDDSFDVLIQARDLLQVLDHAPGGDGALFQIPIGDPRGHADGDRHRRAARAATAATRSWSSPSWPMLLPGADPVTMVADDAPDRRSVRGLYPFRLAARPARARAPRRARTRSDDAASPS